MSAPSPGAVGARRTADARRSPWLAHLVTAGLVIAGAYGLTWAVSEAAESERAQLVGLDRVEVSDLPRPQAVGSSRLADSLAAALRSIHDARRSTIGLFPRYDAAALDRAAAALSRVADQAEPSSWVSQEARLALGRVHLARQRDTEAARTLGLLVREGGYRAPLARRLLDAIRAEPEG